MSATDPILVSYDRAIRKMKGLDPDNPLSWTYQAGIHGSFFKKPNHPEWASCEHCIRDGTRTYFWPWHRMYLYWFERIVAKMADDPFWTLPYWNVSDSNQRKLPTPFRNPSSAFFAPRDDGWNKGLCSFKDSQVDYSAALDCPRYFDGSIYIQGTVHNNVHTLLKGDMRLPETAALDPIFFLHHSNIDRLWDIWLAQAKDAADPIDDQIWRDKEFTFFDENGYQATMKVCDVLRAQEQLGYSYEGEPPQSDQNCKVPIGTTTRRSTFTEKPLLEIPGFPREFTSNLPFPVPLDGIPDLNSILDDVNRRVFLTLTGVENQCPPAVVWDIYLGPGDTDRSGCKSPFFIGTMSMFLRNGTFRYPVSRALAETIQCNKQKKRKQEAVINLIAYGPLCDGVPTTPTVSSTTTITKATLTVETMVTS